MDVIAFAARKGGVGKTLLTASMSVLAAQSVTGRKRNKRKVAVVDLDPQGCLTSWHNQRAESAPSIVETSLAGLPTQLEWLRQQGTDYVMIDTPPGHGSILLQAMRLADLIVIPVRPSELDVAAALRTVEAANRVGVRYALLPNGAPFRSRAMGAAIRNLQRQDLLLLPPVHLRVGLMLEGGRTGSERLPISRCSDELTRAWRSIASTLRGTYHG